MFTTLPGFTPSWQELKGELNDVAVAVTDDVRYTCSMLLNATTTSQAATFADLIEKMRADRVGRRGIHSELREAVISYSQDLNAIFEPAVADPTNKGVVEKTLRQAVEFWNTRFPHADYVTKATHPNVLCTYERDNFISPVTGYDLIRELGVHGVRLELRVEYLARSVGVMFADANSKDVSGREFDAWLDRYATWYSTYGTLPTPFIWQDAWDLGALRRFTGSQWDGVREVVLELVHRRQHSPDMLRSLGAKHAGPVGFFLTAEQLSDLLDEASPATVKQLFSLDTHGRQALTPELLAGLVKAGFTKGAEVKDYARTFGIPFTDATFYDRAIRAKTLYPRLEDYIPVA